MLTGLQSIEDRSCNKCMINVEKPKQFKAEQNQIIKNPARKNFDCECYIG